MKLQKLSKNHRTSSYERHKMWLKPLQKRTEINIVYAIMERLNLVIELKHVVHNICW